MNKINRFIKFFLFLYCLETVFILNPLSAQQLPEQIEEPIDQSSESFNAEEVPIITITSDQDTVHLESMLSLGQLADTYSYAFEMLNVEGAQEITAAYLQNGYSLSDVAKILKNANFSLEDTCKGMINVLGQDGLSEIIGALLEAKFKSSDVFKLAINLVKQANPELTDNQIIEIILGASVDPVNLKTLVKEIFIQKVSSVSDSIKSDLVIAMIDSGFSLNEITTALSENGFNIDQIAQIYSIGSFDIGLTYDLLLNIQNSQESDVAKALISSSYSKNEAFKCIADKLIGSRTPEQIVVIALGTVSAEDPEQLNNAISLGSVLAEQPITTTEISKALLSVGFDLENTTAVLNGMGINLDNAFASLLSAQDGEGVANIAQALISNGFDIQQVFSLSEAELKNQAGDLNQIVNLLIGAIDSEVVLTQREKNNAILLADVLLNAGDSLADIAGAFSANGFSLENIAKIFKGNSIDAQNVYNALSSMTNGNYAGVAVTMIDVGFSVTTVIDLAVIDIKAAQFSDADIFSLLIETVPEDKLPTPIQVNIAIYLTKTFASQGTALSEIGTNLINQGFNQDYVAKTFKNAEISISDAFPVLLGLNTGGFDELCLSLRSANYKGTDIIDIAVTTLQAQGQDNPGIITSLLTSLVSGKPVLGTNLNNARDLVTYLIDDGCPLQEIYQGLQSLNFSLSDIAKVMPKTTVYLELVFSDLLALNGGQDISVVAEALVKGGYRQDDVLKTAVNELKTQNYTTEAIINTLAGTVDQEKGPNSYQRATVQILLNVLSNDGADLVDISSGLITSGFSLTDIAGMMKKSNIDLLPSYNALLNGGNGQDSTSVIYALNQSGYSMASLFQAIVPELQAQEYSVDQMITFLIGHISGAMSEPTIKNMHTLVYVFSEAGISTENICTAMHAVGILVVDTAKIVYRKIGDESEAYNLLTEIYGTENIGETAIGMINAGYSIGVVLNIVVPEYEKQNVAMPEIVGLILAGNPLDQKIKLSEKLMRIFVDKGNSVGSICQSFFASGIDLTNIAGILKTINTEFNEAYNILSSISPSQQTKDIAFALIDGDFDNQLVINAAVDDLKSSGNDNAQIINLFLGAVNPKIGLNNTGTDCAVSLIKKLSADGGSFESICNDLSSTGLTIERILPLMLSAEVSIENTFNAMLGFDGGKEPVELAKILINSNYNSKEVLVVLVDHLQALSSDNTVNTIIAMVIGDIDPDEGFTVIQQGYANVLSSVFLEKNNSIESVASGLLNHGISLADTAVVLKKSGCEAEETYTGLMTVYTPEESQTRTKDITAKMISAGYDSFALYSLVIKKLNIQGISSESEIINILIGPVNSEDSQQLINAGKLSLVMNFNKAKTTAQNTVESFINLFEQGFNIDQITKMLDEGGVSKEEVDATLMQNLNGIVQELAKSGLAPENIVKLLINPANKTETIRPIAEQLKRNDFSTWEVRSAFYSLVGGMYSTDWTLINQGLDDAKDYALVNTQESQVMSSMLNDGQTLTHISLYFAEQGYQISFIAKLFKTMEQPLEEIFTVLEDTKAAYNSDLLVNDTAAPIALLKYFTHKEVFTCAAQYYQQRGISSEQIILKLMSSEVKVDSTSVVADTIVGEYYKGKANIETQSFITIMGAGYSVGWIKNALLEKSFTSDTIESFIQDTDNFGVIFNALYKQMNVRSIVDKFEIEQSPGEYTVLLAEHMIKNKLSETEVNSILLKYDVDPSWIQQGISRGLS